MQILPSNPIPLHLLFSFAAIAKRVGAAVELKESRMRLTAVAILSFVVLQTVVLADASHLSKPPEGTPMPTRTDIELVSPALDHWD